MAGRFTFQKLAKYPHMKPEDVAVWERFIAQNPAFFETVSYDVPCGRGAEVNPDHPEEIQRDHTILTQKKIDVVGFNGNIATVVEIGPIADMRKLGQILTYYELFTTDHPEIALIQKMVICGSIERELEKLFERNEIQVEVA